MKILLGFFLTLGLAYGQFGVFPLTAARITGGAGAPSASTCANSSAVGRVYVRKDAAAVGSSFYSCDNTASMTFAWEVVGVNAGGTAYAPLASPTLTGTPAIAAATGTSLVVTGALSGATYSTATNCADSAGAAACGSAAAGAFVADAAATTVVVSTTAVTADSEIFVFYDSSLNTRLSVTCNTTIPALYAVTARSAGVSFTLTTSANVTNPGCYNYRIVN